MSPVARSLLARRRAALALGASLLAVSAAQGQTLAPEPTPPRAPGRPIAIGPDGKPAGLITPSEVSLDTLSVTGTKTEERAIDALSGTSVVTREQINRIQPSRLSDVLRDVPGVTTQENQNDPAQAINIRGLQDFGRVNVLIDGARQDFQTSGHSANGVFYLDPELVGGIDITRGPTSTIYGSGAIGGVVAFRTRSIDDILAPDETAGAVQKFGFGSNGQRFLNSTALGARIGTAADVFGQFVYRNNGPYRDGLGTLVRDTGNELQSGLAKFNIRPADGHEISGTALLQRFDFANQGSSNAGARFANAVDADTYTLGYRFARPDVPLVDFSIKGYATTTHNTLTYLSDTASLLYGRLGVRAGDRINYDIDTKGFDVHNTARFDTWDFRHALTIGGDAVFNHVKTSDAAGGFGSAFTPSGDRTLAGAFIQDEIRYASWLRVIGALRYDHYELSGGVYRASGERVSPKITVGVSPLPGIEFYGTYAEGYRAPSITETLVQGVHPFPAFNILPNPGLRPEVAHNVEGGVNLKYDEVLRPGDAFRAKLAVFQNDVDNYINIQGVGPTYFVPAIAGIPASVCARIPGRFPCVIPVQSFQYVNVAQAELSGVELEGAYDWRGGFISLAATHTDGRDRSNNQTLISVPPDRISTTLGLRFLNEALTVGTRLNFVEARVNLPTGTTTLATKGYGLVDFFASYQVNDRIRADFILQNAFDKRYRQYLNALYNPGLVAKAAVSIKFATR
ncbi:MULTISPECIES: TonB-dependent hemoglobin/transferrin/lactoferrin family receptor [Methylobacterium]|uniref:Heme/hemopexin utilization protein C n=4 Tax=Pseudomonadota TaxID=1224 RepID=A0ABQ4SYW0_9HYPH|nr:MULTISPECIES: TonB-dependent hemoglobin/transferrin/lactoferrin family receptor [Methylobacterium]PIU06016.1 MAG: TonB-dependent receptor [Methylobacterium sp. CG09_land_8_20_14_0_10_71_15]PIU11783.1 MAG: TonB-dependent receptor [Methylobacterium sp. CG08_land_8_20_14_0_20_71_15]GBU16319.1 ligand-gated channel protein [Methylobacterium sp.]GJE08400.1 Heme/hemopexin utilization protein C [Methylobacterium jeotgali]